MATKNQDGTLSIEAWSLVEFLPEVIKAHDEGYILDMDKNTGVPQQFGAMVTITMFPKPEAEKPVVEATTPVEVKTEEVVPEVITAAPVGVQVETAPDSGVFENHEVPVPVKVDGRRKKI